MAKNSDGWDAIFGTLPIVEQVDSQGYFDISADQIKAISGREPRLMTKIDFREHLPPVMAQEGMAILAISNGRYRIGRFDPFIPLQGMPRIEPERVAFPSGIVTFSIQQLAHESTALDAALLSGILKQVFGEDVALTIRGRTRSPDMHFSWNGIDFPVSGVQVEVDGGYEGAQTVNLVEAKIGSRSNLNIRQLVYPHLAWTKAVGHQKTVRTFVCFYEEPVLRFIPICYVNGTCYADHAHEKAFILENEADLKLAHIPAQADASPPMPDVPFPQADRFETVMAMFNIVVRDTLVAKEELLTDFDIDPRQIDYYSNAMRWMGLVTVNRGIIQLNDQGRHVASLSHADKLKYLAQIVFREPIFNHVLHHGTAQVPVRYFERWRCESESTRNRRLQTVKAWIAYFQAHSKPE